MQADAVAAALGQAHRSEWAFVLSATVPDDRLRLVFTCCHPTLAPEARGASGPSSWPCGTASSAHGRRSSAGRRRSRSIRPSSCRSHPSWRFALIGMGAIVILADIFNPLSLD